MISSISSSNSSSSSSGGGGGGGGGGSSRDGQVQGRQHPRLHLRLPGWRRRGVYIHALSYNIV